jgi:hypothetical protein
LTDWETGRSEPQGKLRERLENVLIGTWWRSVIV